MAVQNVSIIESTQSIDFYTHFHLIKDEYAGLPAGLGSIQKEFELINSIPELEQEFELQDLVLNKKDLST